LTSVNSRPDRRQTASTLWRRGPVDVNHGGMRHAIIAQRQRKPGHCMRSEVSCRCPWRTGRDLGAGRYCVLVALCDGARS
jgi:hypothetical protein